MYIFIYLSFFIYSSYRIVSYNIVSYRILYRIVSYRTASYRIVHHRPREGVRGAGRPGRRVGRVVKGAKSSAN